MFQIIYISTRVTGQTVDIDAILQVSRRNNAVAKVTGLLIHDGRRFLQALEGEKSVVMATYARIAADPRHRAVVILSSREIGGPEFGSWAMAAHEARTGTAGRSLSETVDRLTETVADPSTRALFRGFARLDRAAA